MEAQLVKAVSLHQPFEAVVQSLVADVAPQLIGEHQLIRIRPRAPGFLCPGLLLFLLPAQGVHDLIGHGQRADLILNFSKSITYKKRQVEKVHSVYCTNSIICCLCSRHYNNFRTFEK